MNTSRLLSGRVASSLCISCRRSLLRQFSSSHAPFASFQAYPLPSHPPPVQPRNTVVPETSITQAKLPKVHETRPPKNSSPTPNGAAQAAEVSIPESEAQLSKPEFAPSASSASSSSPPATSPLPAAKSTTAPKPRSKLRAPRKAAMKLTPSAVSHLQALLDQPDPKLIKVGVRNRGCSGLAYHLEYVDKAGAFDEAVEQDGVRVLIDSKALFSIIGSEMDWVEDKLSAKFVFRNPNIKEECGCGESFMV